VYATSSPPCTNPLLFNLFSCTNRLLFDYLSVHLGLTSWPGGPVHRSHMMISNIATANWEYIRARKQCLIQKNNKKENKSLVLHTYHVNDKVILCKGTKNKYEAPFSGPHKILKVNTNGTCWLRYSYD
jgi:hypothetical protein